MIKNIGLTFHGFYSESDQDKLCVNKEIFMNVKYVDGLFAKLKQNGYKFKLPENIKSGENKVCIVTIDDGYFNNFKFLELAEKYEIPFILFVCSHNIQNQVPFFWDVAKYDDLQWNFTTDCYAKLYESRNLRAHELMQNDLYRPMTESELKEFVKSEYAHIAVHTHTHQPLVHSDIDALDEELNTNINYLKKFDSFRQGDMALPCGLYSQKLKSELCRRFDRVYTINGGEFNSKKIFINRITLANPELTFDLEEQIEKTFSLRYKLSKIKSHMKNTYYESLRRSLL